MSEFNVSALLYAIVTSAIAWFLLWFAYDTMEISQSLNPLSFTNLALAICLIVFVILGGVEQLKKVLKEMKKQECAARAGALQPKSKKKRSFI